MQYMFGTETSLASSIRSSVDWNTADSAEASTVCGRMKNCYVFCFGGWPVSGTGKSADNSVESSANNSVEFSADWSDAVLTDVSTWSTGSRSKSC